MTQEPYPKLTPTEWLEQRETHMEKHSAWVKDGVVIMANNCDPYYTEAFETREEVERFINYLLQKTDEAWPSTENSIIFSSQNEEVVRLDKEGFHYKGEFIADAGEAHRLMVAFLKQNTAQPEKEVPTDEELLQVFDTVCLSEGGTVDEIHLRGLHAVLARWGK